ncbi:MAG: TolC family protein [Salinisphaera sp.]|nr:TolC family protein [Salinisphaera sp.]
MTALRLHPELARLRTRIAEAKARVGLAKKDFYPDFRLMAGYNNMWPDADMHWTLGLSINLPFDYGNKRSAALGAARASLLQARWQLTDREAQLLSELEAGRAAVEAAKKRIKISIHRLAPLARANLEAALADFRAGAGPFTNVINAERQQLRTKNQLARARADYLRRLAALERWVGAPLAGLPSPTTHAQPNQEATP